MEILKQYISENNLFGQHDYTIQFIDSFQFYVSVITPTHDTHLFVTLSQLFCFFSVLIVND